MEREAFGMTEKNNMSVFIGNLPSLCIEADIRNFFQKCGRIKNVYIEPKKRYYAIVVFQEILGALRAKNLDNTYFKGSVVQITLKRYEINKKRKERRKKEQEEFNKFRYFFKKTYSITVQNVPYGCSLDELTFFFVSGGCEHFEDASWLKDPDFENDGTVELSFGDETSLERALFVAMNYPFYEHKKRLKVEFTDYHEYELSSIFRIENFPVYNGGVRSKMKHVTEIFCGKGTVKEMTYDRDLKILKICLHDNRYVKEVFDMDGEKITFDGVTVKLNIYPQSKSELHEKEYVKKNSIFVTDIPKGKTTRWKVKSCFRDCGPIMNVFINPLFWRILFFSTKGVEKALKKNGTIEGDDGKKVIVSRTLRDEYLGK